MTSPHPAAAMAEPSSRPAGAGRSRDEGRSGYALIAAAVALLYCGIAGPYQQFTSTVLPSGDPFTYTVGYFALLDTAQRDYLAGLQMAFTANWYWMFNVPIALLSPILVKEPVSLSMVTFIVYGFATAAFFRLGRRLRFSPSLALLVTLSLWAFPINFGFEDYSSIPVLGLDSMFVGLLYLASATLLVFVLDPYRWQHAVVAGVSVGLAIWGRGNSILVVGMVGFVPVVALAYRLSKARSIPWTSVAAFALIAGGMAALFYGMQGRNIADYYTAHLAFVQRHTWNWHDAMPYIKNVPGFFFWRVEDSVVTVSVTWLLHLLVAASPLLVWRAAGAHRGTIRLIGATGVFIYVVTYLSMIALFTDPLITLYNCLLIYAPMRIGMTLVVVAVAGTLVSMGRLALTRDIMVPSLAVLVIYGVWLTKVKTPEQGADEPTPRTVAAFATMVADMALANDDEVSVLWYRQYNLPILTYYFRQRGLEFPGDVVGREVFFQAYDYGEEKRAHVRELLRRHFTKAGVIIIPEYVDYYSEGEPYSLYKMRDEIPRFLNSPDSPRFVVRALAQEQADLRLLVLQREDDARGAGEPLKLPYGPSTEPHSDYGSQVVRIGP